ncbi:MAG: glucose-1-phosphate thymidylyltransferase [Chloroflexi bacterium]|nr:glucose-1-phosphate thymidylyltransferase [Anaerolineae bacterium]RLC72548.1 MAG: glucose-1-phosphate thymidylyltransferase [Chloroflexota bacterium]
MKGIILSGGKGTRLRPLSYTNAKQLIPLANKPVLFYAIEQAVEAGIRDLGIIVGDTKEQVKEAVGDGSRWGINVTYIEQDAPRGLAHAVKVAQPFLGEDRFLMMLGDNFTEESIAPFVERFGADESLNCFLFLKKVPDPEKSGVVELRDGKIVRLVEKPKIPPSNLVAIGIYLFDHHVFEAIDRLKPSWRGELEITETIQNLIDDGYTVGYHEVEGWWIDTGKSDDIILANRLALSRLHARVDESCLHGETDVSGPVDIAPSAHIENSVIRGPAIIGENTRIIDSYVGPFTSIYHDVLICNSEIENSVVLEYCEILDVGRRIESSLIGRHAYIANSQKKPKALRLVIADHSNIQL